MIIHTQIPFYLENKSIQDLTPEVYRILVIQIITPSQSRRICSYPPTPEVRQREKYATQKKRKTNFIRSSAAADRRASHDRGPHSSLTVRSSPSTLTIREGNPFPTGNGHTTQHDYPDSSKIPLRFPPRACSSVASKGAPVSAWRGRLGGDTLFLPIKSFAAPHHCFCE